MDSDLQYVYEQYVESSDGSSDEEEYSDETAMMQAVLEGAERTEEHVLNFKGSIKGRRVLNRNRAGGHLTPMADYFAPDALLADNFRRCFRMRKTVFDCLYRVGRSYDDYFILKKDAWERLASLVTESARPHSARLLIRDEYLRMSESTCEIGRASCRERV